MGKTLSIETNTKEVDSHVTSEFPEQMIIKVMVNRKVPADVHIKTCSPCNFIAPSIVKELGLQRVSTSYDMKALSGLVATFQWKCYVELTVPGGIPMENVECIICEPAEPNHPPITLGHKFFKHFKSVSLSYGGDYGKVLAYPHANTSKIDVMIDDVLIEKAHVYSATRQSLISLNFAQRMNLSLCRQVDPTMYSATAPRYSYNMFCLANLKVGANLHESFKFVVVSDLHIDVVLGADFLLKHKAVKILYGGRLPPLKLRKGKQRVMREVVPDMTWV